MLALTGKASDAVHMITSGITASRVNGNNIVDAIVLIIFGERPCENSVNSMTPGAALAKR